MTAVSNLVPFALIDALLAIIVGVWIVTAVRDLVRGGRGGRQRAVALLHVRERLVRAQQAGATRAAI